MKNGDGILNSTLVVTKGVLPVYRLLVPRRLKPLNLSGKMQNKRHEVNQL